jgi:MFS family permease
MSIFPYIYYMIESFHVTNDDKRIALYAGMVTSAFALAEALSSSIWGRLSDKFGRKLILLSGLAGTGISMLAFGFAQSLPAALIARALGGLLNGNIGVLQTTVAEVVKAEEHQGVAFALMPTIWCVGAVVGSALGGSFADPVRSYPDIFRPGGVLDRFPYLLPNLVCSVVVVIGIVVGILFLEETHEDMQGRKDIGLQFGNWIEDRVMRRSFRQSLGRKSDFSGETLVLLHDGDQPPDYRSAASSPGLQATAVGLPPPYQSIDGSDNASERQLDFALSLNSDSLEAANYESSTRKQSSGVWNALTTQLVLNIVGYGILAYHTISAEQLLPVLFSLPESDVPPRLPFWFTGGFALTTKTIGGILSIQGVIQMVSTMVVFPFVERKLGTLTTYRMVVLSYPLLYILVPYLTLVPTTLRMPAIYAILVWKVTAQGFAFPANNMMLAKATPKRALGTFNGFAQSSASLARAIGPSLSGLLEAAGLSRGMLGLPWWFSACIAMMGAVLSLFMTKAKPRCLDPEKRYLGDGPRTIPPAISPEISAALVAADSTSTPEDSVMSRPTSPLLVRISLDIRRDARRGSKF